MTAHQALASLLLVFWIGGWGLGIPEITVVEHLDEEERTLLYYTAGSPETQPALVVKLHQPSANRAIAKVYDAPKGKDRVPVRLTGDSVIIDPEQRPTLVIESLDGWWVREGKISYNLDVQVRGPVYAMWQADADYRMGPNAERPLLAPQQRAANITVRDPAGSGVPKWDFRQLVPLFPGRGLYRGNYAERKCDSPLEIEPGVSPQWPYVAASGNYEQLVGVLRPPIVVDWERGKITHFSELVTVRHQNCTYAFYSITPLQTGKLNSPNFETPFAFYDLSGEGTGKANLILRTERHPVGDEWLVYPQRLDKDFKAIRYSWRNEVGDWLWDYKIEVLGFAPYTFDVPIAGGMASIDAPPYESFPGWVVERAWPVTVFIDTEGNSYASAEGIYEWSTRQIGTRYALGWEEKRNASAFSEIRPGFRGEYRQERSLPPELYFSPLDNRLHLLGAEGGVWNLGRKGKLRVENVSGDLYIDRWILEGPDTYTELVDLGGYLLLADAQGITLRQADAPKSLFSILPPSDEETWRLSRQQLAPWESERRDPESMRGWLEAFPGPTGYLSGATITQLRISDADFSLVLDLPAQLEARGSLRIPALEGLPSGQYLVSYDRSTGAWSSEPATPPHLDVSFDAEALPAFFPSELKIGIENSGTMHLVTPVTLRIGDLQVQRWDKVFIPGNGQVELIASWTPANSQSWQADIEIGEERVSLGTITIIEGNRVGGLSNLSMSTGGEGRALVAVLLLVLVAVGFSVRLAWWIE